MHGGVGGVDGVCAIQGSQLDGESSPGAMQPDLRGGPRAFENGGCPGEIEAFPFGEAQYLLIARRERGQGLVDPQSLGYRSGVIGRRGRDRVGLLTGSPVQPLAATTRP